MDSNEEASLEVKPDEETLLAESHDIKAEANQLFVSKDYSSAISRYHDALRCCPRHLHFPRAVLQSNLAVCHLKLEEWTDAIKAATDAIDGLGKVDDNNSEADKILEAEKKSEADTNCEADESSQADKTVDISQTDITRIRIKALLRRARARSEAGGWHNLAGAEEDYKSLAGMSGLVPADARTVRTQLAALPARTKAAQEAETAEMWSKLKGLGNSVLRPFGLSTDNFNMVKDERTGGYSMNFTQQP